MRQSRRSTQKVILIDRDGVINKDPGGWTEHDYVTSPKDFQFLPGSLEALRILKKEGFKVIVISNQAGVGKGYFTKQNLDELNKFMLSEVKKNGGMIDDVFYCTHSKEDNCGCRKPKTGMFEMAVKRHDIDLRGTYFVGDSYVDMGAGKKLGMRTVFVLSGKYTLAEARKWPDKPDYVFDNLLGVVTWLVNKTRRKDERSTRRKTQ